MTALSVVLITRDQAFNVVRLIDSVLAEAPDAEVVVVDSASVDGTPEAAATRPVRVLRLHPGQVLSAAAGRLVGHRHAHGERVLFLDGDMVLAPGWLAQAEAVLEAEPDIAVVGGEIVDVARDHAGAAPEHAPAGWREVRHTGGAALIRRGVLDAVGSFNPYLRSDEEPELCIRIRHAGHRVVMLERPAVLHLSDPPDALATVLARRRRGLYLGAGQAIRHNLGHPALPRYLRERGFGLLPGAGLLAGLLAALTRRGTLVALWSLAVAGTISGDLYRRGSPRATLHSLLLRLCIVEGTVRGFLGPAPDPRGYSPRLDVIREI